MKYVVLLVIILSSCKSSPEKKSESESKTYQDIHNGAIVVDTHNDILMKVAGKDATALFDKYHRWVNLEGLMEPACLVGFLVR